ncbi:phospholipase D family protein [Sphingomonas sp. SUN039]|uniref:phospholipase D family protein n=1 Tax=Sphingomonas sp. SUN039 TaxID=2937787 RepID=UPI0021645CE8|nr:phospholipase D family protein [Sphingomonas sp. SUN039]UVO54406.1 phospholipase D family protein [Sphingomonas sp. SUN039]
MTELLLSSAFANAAGVGAVSAVLAPVAGQCQAFIGVRNGSTTAQALAALLRLGVTLYGVDTATRSRIFHPKLFLAKGNARARAVIGSANLTHAGLFNNIEAGADLELDLNSQSDNDFVDSFLNGFQDLVANHPVHCFPIISGRQIIDLMRQGLLEDERNPKTQTAYGAGKQGPQTSKLPISLPLTPAPKKKPRKPKPPIMGGGALTVFAPPTFGQLVWVKPSLPFSDLQLNQSSNVPGVLRLTQAGYQVNGQTIDQKTYFRNQVFSQLIWVYDAAKQKDVAGVPISLIIAGVYVGDFDLSLSHKPTWAAGQGNYTTGLHWASATSHIKQPGLVGRSLRLYQPFNPQARFVIEIN